MKLDTDIAVQIELVQQFGPTNLPRRDVYKAQPMHARMSMAAINGHTLSETTPFATFTTISTAGMGNRYGASIP